MGFIHALFAEGWNEQKILENYPQFTVADLQAIFAYTAACLKDEEFIALKHVWSLLKIPANENVPLASTDKLGEAGFDEVVKSGFQPSILILYGQIFPILMDKIPWQFQRE